MKIFLKTCTRVMQNIKSNIKINFSHNHIAQWSIHIQGCWKRCAVWITTNHNSTQTGKQPKHVLLIVHFRSLILTFENTSWLYSSRNNWTMIWFRRLCFVSLGCTQTRCMVVNVRTYPLTLISRSGTTNKSYFRGLHDFLTATLFCDYPI